MITYFLRAHVRAQMIAPQHKRHWVSLILVILVKLVKLVEYRIENRGGILSAEKSLILWILRGLILDSLRRAR